MDRKVPIPDLQGTMTEIASNSTFQTSTDLATVAQRDSSSKKGAPTAASFGAMISDLNRPKTAWENAAKGNGPESPRGAMVGPNGTPASPVKPEPKTPWEDAPNRPARFERPVSPSTPERQPALDVPRPLEPRDEVAPNRPAEPTPRVRDDKAEPVVEKKQPKTAKQPENREVAPNRPAVQDMDVAEGDGGEAEQLDNPDLVKQEAKPCETGTNRPAQAGMLPDAPNGSGAGAETAAEQAVPVAVLVESAPALPDVETAGPLAASPGTAILTADGDVQDIPAGSTAPGLVRASALVAETPAAPVLAALAAGDKPQDIKTTSAPATPDVSAPEAVATPSGKGAADLVALLQSSRQPEAAARVASGREQVAPEMPKTNFGDWINEFAIAQGAVHRSGDLVGSLDRAVAGLPTPHAGQDALRPTPLQMLPIEIGMQAMRGVKTFQIRLDPAELGRVDVKLEIKDDGEVKANLVVDRVETLAMLKRDASTLQQAFEQAGLRQSPDGLSFQLRGEQQGREGQRQNDEQARPRWSNDVDETGAQLPAEFVMRRVMIPNSSLDLVI